jgi:hypothetical protein
MGEREDCLRDFERDGLDQTKVEISLQLCVWCTQDPTQGRLPRSGHDPDQ